MKDGFIRVAAATPTIRVADPVYNRSQIVRLMREGAENKARLMVFPELCLTGYSCQDLFLQAALIRSAKAELKKIIEASADLDMLVFIGLPWEHEGKLYNTAAAVSGGKLLGLVPKVNLPNYSEFYEARHFCPGNEKPVVLWDAESKEEVLMGSRLLFVCDNMPELVAAAEICEDLWVPSPPSIAHTLAGATVVANCSASNETIGKDKYRRELICGQSARLVCSYIYANAGEGESTQDLVFGGQNMIAENGTLLKESARFGNETIYADIDLQRIGSERKRMNTHPAASSEGYTRIRFSLNREAVEPLRRFVDKAPFVPADLTKRKKRCEEILMIQAMGLKKRMQHTNTQYGVVGISGGLDSTLALLVMARTFDLLNIPRKNICAVTMPSFGTTGRTYHNACVITEMLGATLREVNISAAVRQHFNDIGHDETIHDVTYENSQARERTQVLMDIANQVGGLVVGTGDMSELALGWATYNGDHMSMYGVNAGVPKTLVRHLVRYCADETGHQQLQTALYDVLDTPVSPELLPPKEGEIAQKTEDLVGPYELHDFFLYYVLRFGCRPEKIYRLARLAFGEEYPAQTIHRWLTVFYRRFISQQFKRSCLPDGPKVGSVALSPRGDLRMPSDASAAVWLAELERIKP